MPFKIFRKNCCGLDVHKTWIYACVGITDLNNRTEYKQARFSSFTKGLNELCDWLAKYNCKDVCMESTGKYWIPVFNILEKTCWVTLAHPKYTKPQKGNKTDRKDAKWICDLFMCDIIKPSFIPPPDIRQLRDHHRRFVKNLHPLFHNRYVELYSFPRHLHSVLAQFLQCHLLDPQRLAPVYCSCIPALT